MKAPPAAPPVHRRLRVAAGAAVLAWAAAALGWAHGAGQGDLLAAEAADLAARERAARLRVAEAGPTDLARARLAALTARTAARAETGRHLRVDRAARTAELFHGDYRLRRFEVVVPGDALHTELPPSLLAPPFAAALPHPVPAGSYRVTGAWGPSVAHTGVRLPDPPDTVLWPDGEPPPEGVVDVLALDGRLLLYSAVPRAVDRLGPARPGTLRAAFTDLRAVADDLATGAMVHVW